MTDPTFLIVAASLGLSGIVSAAKLISWFLEGDPKAIAQAGRWGAAGLFVLSFPLLLGLMMNQRWPEAIGLSAVMLMAFALYGPRILGQILPRRRLVPDQSFPSEQTTGQKSADAASCEAEMVQRSIAVLEEYLLRTTRANGKDVPRFRASNPQITAGQQGHHNGASRELTSPLMSEFEALQVLGLRPDAGASEINEAHRRLMQIVHPDRGGSQYFAVKVNQAKDVLLNRLQPQPESSATATPRKRRRRGQGQSDSSEPKSSTGE